jgi:hypothetical protein
MRGTTVDAPLPLTNTPDTRAKDASDAHQGIAPIIPHMILENITLMPTDVVIQSLLVADLNLLAEIHTR